MDAIVRAFDGATYYATNVVAQVLRVAVEQFNDFTRSTHSRYSLCPNIYIDRYNSFHGYKIGNKNSEPCRFTTTKKKDPVG
jgi:hypothetical protein